MSRDYGITNVAPWAAAPAVGAAGDTYFNTASKTLYVSDGTSWVAIGEPPGTVKMFAGNAAQLPPGYLICDGAAVSRTTYAALFAAIGTLHGVGDGSTTFAVPNLKKRLVMGYDSTDPNFNVVGNITGSPSHNHSLSDNACAQLTMQAGTGADLIRIRRINVPAGTNNYNANISNSSSLSISNSSAANGTGIGLQGNTDAVTTYPPTVVMHYIIKT